MTHENEVLIHEISAAMFTNGIKISIIGVLENELRNFLEMKSDEIDYADLKFFEAQVKDLIEKVSYDSTYMKYLENKETNLDIFQRFYGKLYMN